MTDPAKPVAQAEALRSVAAKALFDGALQMFEGHLINGHPHIVTQARSELHDRLDGLLDAKADQMAAIMRQFGR